MKKNLLVLVSLICNFSIMGNSEESQKLFADAFSRGDKKSVEKLMKKFPDSEFAEVFRILDAVPDNVEIEKTTIALNMANALIARSPQFDVAYFIRAMLYFDLVTSYSDAESKYTGALHDDIEKAAALGVFKRLPNGMLVQFKLMACYSDYQHSHYESAVSLCDEGLKIDKTERKLHRYRGMALYMLRDYKASVKSFDVTLKDDGKDTYILNLRGLAKLQSQDFKGALADATAGKKLDANMSDFMILSGRAKVALGKRRDGCIELQAAAAMGHGADAQVWLNELCQ